MLGGTSSSTRPRRSALAPALALAREDHVERRAQADEPGQPLAATGAGNETELHLGETELGLRVVGGDAVVTGERELETGSEAGAVDGGDDGRRKGVSTRLTHLLALEAEPLGRALRGERGELLDVGARDEVVGLARDEDGRADRRCRRAAG